MSNTRGSCSVDHSCRFERLHPRPDWASRRLKSGTPALSSLLRSTKSFIAPSIPSSTSHRSPLPRGFIDIHRLLDANHQNPTTGKKEASNAGNGVIDIAWHPSSRVGVLAVAGGDRRVRFFNVSFTILLHYLGRHHPYSCCRNAD